jgi:hypothetical protein
VVFIDFTRERVREKVFGVVHYAAYAVQISLYVVHDGLG